MLEVIWNMFEHIRHVSTMFLDIICLILDYSDLFHFPVFRHMSLDGLAVDQQRGGFAAFRTPCRWKRRRGRWKRLLGWSCWGTGTWVSTSINHKERAPPWNPDRYPPVSSAPSLMLEAMDHWSVHLWATHFIFFICSWDSAMELAKLP